MKNTNLVLGMMLIMLLVISSSLTAQNNCLDFDGSNDYVEVPADPSQDITDAITIEAWVKPGSADHYQNILEKGSYYDDAYALLVKQDIQYIKFSLVGIDQHWGYGPVNLWDGKWHHIAGTYDKNGGSNNTNLYVDGYCVKSETKTGSITSDPSKKIYIGGHSYDGNLFNGPIDEVRLWNVARTEAEIRANMYREILNPTSEANLVAYYKFNETTGATADNAEGTSALDGTLHNMDNSDWQTSPAFAGPKNCLDFDGSDDYVEVADDPSLYQNNTITVSAWIYPRNLSAWGWKRIIEKNSSNKDGWTFFHSLFYNSELYVDIDGDCVNSNQIISENQWQHIAFTYNSTHLKIYYNGEEVYSAPKSYTFYSANPLIIGRAKDGGDYFNGIIDEVCIWNTALTAQQIRENMCKTLVGDETGLIAYYNFDNTAGTTLQDFSGNANDGTLTNMDPTTDWVSSSAFNTWLNTNSSSWSTATNWSRGSVPTATDNVGIVDYTGGTAPSLSGSPTLNNLVVDDTFTLTSGVTINNQLIIESDLYLNGQTVTLGASANLIESAGYICGTSGTITTARTLNNISSVNVGGLGAEITTSSNMGSTVITRGVTAQTGGGHYGIKRYYNIEPTNNIGLSATLVLHYADSELNGINADNLELFSSTDNGSTWTSRGGTVNTTLNTITVNGIDAFFRWTAGDKNSPLPVELSSFTANCLNGMVTLNWTTESELNNSGFDIERKRTENANWTKIGFVEGHGTVNTTQSYVYEDKNLTTGKYSYRLKQIDHNGNYEYFCLNSDVLVGAPSKFNISQNYPNPFNPKTNIRFELPNDSKVSIKIFDMLGREVTTLVDGFKEAGYHTVEFDGSNLSSGMYFYRIQTESFEAVKRMLLIK